MTRNCGRLLISQGSCDPTDLCKVFGDEVMCITIKMLCLVKLHFACFWYFWYCWKTQYSTKYTMQKNLQMDFNWWMLGFPLVLWECFQFQSHVHFNVSQRFVVSSLPAMVASWWPSHNEIRGEKSRHEIKVSSSGSRISGVWAQAGAPLCLGSDCTVSTADQPWISVVLHQQWHLSGISNAVSCTCCALCPDAWWKSLLISACFMVYILETIGFHSKFQFL